MLRRQENLPEVADGLPAMSACSVRIALVLRTAPACVVQGAQRGRAKNGTQASSATGSPHNSDFTLDSRARASSPAGSPARCELVPLYQTAVSCTVPQVG